METSLAAQPAQASAAADSLEHGVLVLTCLTSKEVNGQGVGDDHDDHGNVKGGQGAKKGETSVVNDALVAGHDVGRVHEAQSADGRADEQGKKPDENDTDDDKPLGTAACQVGAPSASAVSSRLERAPNSQIAAQADAAHVKDRRGASENIARYVDVAPRHS